MFNFRGSKVGSTQDIQKPLQNLLQFSDKAVKATHSLQAANGQRGKKSQ